MESNKTEWGIDIVQERDYWKKYLLNVYIKIQEKCNICNKGYINLRQNQSLINPFLGKCNYNKCLREIYLRKGTIFQFNSKTPAQVLHTIIKLWLNDEMNIAKIADKLTENFLPDKIDKRFIYAFISKCRLAIANYMRQIYILDYIAPKNSHFHITVDESLPYL